MAIALMKRIAILSQPNPPLSLGVANSASKTPDNHIRSNHSYQLKNPMKKRIKSNI
jgi:hypothetical protein